MGTKAHLRVGSDDDHITMNGKGTNAASQGGFQQEHVMIKSIPCICLTLLQTAISLPPFCVAAKSASSEARQMGMSALGSFSLRNSLNKPNPCSLESIPPQLLVTVT